AAMLHVTLFRFPFYIDDERAAFAHRAQHPNDIVTVRVDRVSKVETAAAALRAGDDEQVGEAVAMQAQESSGPFRFPLILQSAAAAAGHHVEGGSAHPLEPGRVDQHVEWIFDALVDDAALVYLADAARRGINQMDVRQVERLQILIMEGRPL